MKKSINIYDNSKVMDRIGPKKTDILIKDKESGKVLYRGSNKVIVSGSELNALKDFDFNGYDYSGEQIDFLSTIKSYDEALSENGHPLTPIGTDEYVYTNASPITALETPFGNGTFQTDIYYNIYKYIARRVSLFCVGIDGCGIEASRVFKVHNTKWIAPWGYSDYNDGTGGDNVYDYIDNCLIPFKYRTLDADLTSTYRSLYYGRSQTSDAIAYYFKTFDATPELIRRYADDSTDLAGVEDVWKDTRSSEAEVVVKLQMSITNTDCREYFNKSTGTNDSKINTISLCSAVPVKYQSLNVEYVDIRPFTRFNFPNEALVDTSKGVEISYYLYY